AAAASFAPMARAQEGKSDAEGRKRQVVELLKSIETGDPKPVAVINPRKYTQHNLAVADGLEGFGALLKQLPPHSARVNWFGIAPRVRALCVRGIDGFRRLTRLRSGSAVAARPHCPSRGVSAGVSRRPTRARLAHTTRKQPSRRAPPGIGGSGRRAVGSPA